MFSVECIIEGGINQLKSDKNWAWHAQGNIDQSSRQIQCHIGTNYSYTHIAWEKHHNVICAAYSFNESDPACLYNSVTHSHNFVCPTNCNINAQMFKAVSYIAKCC